MVKRCSHCGATKSVSEFTPRPDRPSGYMSWCKPCVAERSRAYYHRTNGEKARARYKRDPAKRKAQTRAWREVNPDKVREYSRRQVRTYDPEKGRVKYMKRHGGMDEWARMFAAQGGLCYLCGESLEEAGQKFVHVDHDHDCCPSGQTTESCRACRRGLAHARCNQIIGLCGEDMGRLRAIIANFEPARDAAAARIAVKKATQPQLIPLLDMPEGIPG